MPRPQTQSFEEMFGVGSVPIASYFGLPQGASADTRFSPQARGMLAQGEEYAREQAAMEAELAAEELLGGAADMTDEQIQQQLLRSPKMFGTEAIQPLSGYMKFRQSTTPQTDVTLGPILREKITDPYHREQFEKRMLEGASANDAFDAYRTDEYNMKFETALAEAGVPETEYAKLKTPSGKFIPAAVARAKQAAEMKAEETKRALTRRTSDDPIDRKIDAYERAMEQREKIFKATGREAELAKDQTYLGYMAKLEEANKAKFAMVDPAPKPVIGPATSIPISAAAPARPISPERENLLKTREEYKNRGGEEKRIADTEWTNQKKNLYQSIGRVYGDENKVLGLALDIAEGVTIPQASSTIPLGDAPSSTVEEVPLAQIVADKMGVKLSDVAFVEPGNVRTGSQKVTYAELIREWAKEIKERYDASQSQTGQPAPASGKFSVGAPVKVGGP